MVGKEVQTTVCAWDEGGRFSHYKELKLSDTFIRNDTKIDLPLELVVQVYNINKGRNQEILSKSKTLDSYSLFIGKIREYQREYGEKYRKKEEILDKAFKSAIKYCIKNNVLKDFLKKHGSEIMSMLYAEYDHEVEKRVVRKEAFEDGMEIGLEKGREKERLIIAKNLLAKRLTPEFVHEITGLSGENTGIKIRVLTKITKEQRTQRGKESVVFRNLIVKFTHGFRTTTPAPPSCSSCEFSSLSLSLPASG